MSGQISGYSSAYVTDAMKYIQHLGVVEHKENLGEDLKSSLMMSPLMAVPSALSAKGDFYKAKSVIETGKTAEKVGFFKKLRNIPSTISKSASGAHQTIKEGNALKTMGTVLKNSDAVTAMQDLNTLIAQAAANNKDTKELIKAKNAISDALKSGDKMSDALKNADSLIDATRAANKGKIATFFSKLGTPFTKAGAAIKNSGAYQAVEATKTGSKVLEKMGKFGKLAKRGGAVFDLAIEGTMQLFTEVIPAFKQGGIGSGIKQIGKSGAQVAGSVGGWVAGAKAGSALGAAVGSIFPVAGTVVGGAIGGIIGGFLGSSLLSGLAKKITGKSEKEKIAEQQTQEQAQMIAQDPQALAQLQSQVQAQLQADIQSGNVTEDTMKMAQYLENTSSQTAFTGNNTSFGSLTNNANTNAGLSIATDVNGNYDFSVPQSAYPQIAGASNPYGLYQMA